MNLFFIDTETGGLDPQKHSILSVGIAIATETEIIDKIEIKIKEPKIKAVKAALKINRIDIDELVKVADDPVTAVEKILALIKRHPNLYRDKQRIVVFGHNVYFDVSFLRRLFGFTDYRYEDYFCHRTVDTSSILRFLSLRKMFDKDISGLDSALNHFNMNENPRHEALQDAVLTARLFQKLLDLKM